MTTVADNFNRANETPLASPWVGGIPGENNFNLSSNQAVPANVANDSSMIYTGATFNDNQSSAGNLTGNSAGSGGLGVGLTVRHSSSANTGYRMAVGQTNVANNVEFGRFNAGTFTSLQQFSIGAWSNGDLFEFRAVGAVTAVVLTLFRNGTQVATFTDTSASGIASGFPGLALSATADSASAIDNWVGTDNFSSLRLDAPVTAGSGVGVDTREVTYTLQGTVAKNGTTTLTGTNTVFLSELRAGDAVRVPGGATETRIVASISSDTSLTVTAAFANTASGQTASRVNHRQVMQEGTSAVATPTSVAAAAADTTLLAANTNRIGASVWNDSTADLYLKYGTGASSTSFTVKLGPGGYWEMPIPKYTGQINGRWSSAVGFAYVTETVP